MRKHPLQASEEKQWRRTKIIATLGPSSNTRNVIEQLIHADVNVFRLNLSHGDHEAHRQVFSLVRAVAERTGRHVAVLADLGGPKIRTGTFTNGGITLRADEDVTVTTRRVQGAPNLIPSQYRNLHQDVRPGDRILLDDGNIELKVVRISGRDVRCRVRYGGTLSDRKGINLPDSPISAPTVTAKDKRDILFAIDLGVDYLALSFVREAKDVVSVKRILNRRGADIAVIAKIEKPEAVANINEILAVADGIMVARGDLGIELPSESVPLIQRRLIEQARRFNCPAIIATHMLESMVSRSRPTRAEVGDVANAALSSADAVMLSAETASGAFPVQAAQTMDRVLREIERHQLEEGLFAELLPYATNINTAANRDAVAHAMAKLARGLPLQGIVIPTRGGTTARVMAADRPTAPLIAVTTDPAICRRLALYWGVVPTLVQRTYTRNWQALCDKIAAQYHLRRKGYPVLLVSGFHDDPKYNAPVLKVMQI